jgi:hypothetical protein
MLATQSTRRVAPGLVPAELASAWEHAASPLARRAGAHRWPQRQAGRGARLRVVQVDQDQRAVGVLGLGGADKTPERGVTQVADVVAGTRVSQSHVGSARQAGMSPVARLRARPAAMPALGAWHHGPPGRARLFGANSRDDHDLGHTTALPDSGMERGQVGVAFDLDRRLRERCAEASVVPTEQRPPHRGRRRADLGPCRPLDAVERFVLRRKDAGLGFALERRLSSAGRPRMRPARPTRPLRPATPCRFALATGQAHAQAGSSGCPQGHARPGEGKRQLACPRAYCRGPAREAQRQSNAGCRPNLTGILRYPFGQVDLGKQLLSPLPGRAQALKACP